MKKNVIIFILFIFSFNAFSEEILRSVVMPLTEEDYNKSPSVDCRSFSEVLVEAKNEWRHIIPFKLIEQGLINYKDVSDEVITILKSKRDEIVFKMKLASKEEVDILNKRISNLEKKLEEKKKRKKTSKAKK